MTSPAGRLGRWLAVGLGIGLLALVAGGTFAWSGLYSVSALEGHWPLTRGVLEFVKENSVETHAWGVEAPPRLDDPALVALGLGHYDGGCEPCHGAPGHRRNPIALGAIPFPPYLPAVVEEWTPEELFWVVRNGLKYTGMPAWPAPERHDEVWAVVAALRVLPALDAAGYRHLTRRGGVLDVADAEANAQTIALAGAVGDALIACARCHGLRGEGGGSGAFPRLAGQPAPYLAESLRDYALGVRPSGVMHPIAAELSDDDMRDLADYFAGVEVPGQDGGSRDSDSARWRLGATIAETGIPARSVPSCEPCHGENAAPIYPRLAGQLETYLVRQLELWRSGLRDATPAAQVMTAFAQPLRDDEIAALAHYYSTLDPRAQARGDGERP